MVFWTNAKGICEDGRRVFDAVMEAMRKGQSPIVVMSPMGAIYRTNLFWRSFFWIEGGQWLRSASAINYVPKALDGGVEPRG